MTGSQMAGRVARLYLGEPEDQLGEEEWKGHGPVPRAEGQLQQLLKVRDQSVRRQGYFLGH